MISNPTSAGVATGTATLGTNGTVTIPNPSITTHSIIRLNRQAPSGTLGELAATLTAGTGFQNSSSSSSERSQIFWEIVSY